MLVFAHLNNLNKQSPLPDVTGLLRQTVLHQLSSDKLSLGFWLCPLVLSLGKWGLLSWPILGRYHCLSSEVRREVLPTKTVG